MIYSKTCEYAIRALGYFQNTGANGHATVGDVSRVTKVPRAYVAKIFQALVKSGILDSKPGPGGGFYLRVPPKELTVLKIMTALDDPQRSPFTRCIMGLHDCNDRNPCPLHEIWSGAKEKMKRCVSQCSVFDLTDLADDFAKPDKKKKLSRRMRHVFGNA